MTTTQTRPAVLPFRVTVTRNRQQWIFDVRGTHDMLFRLCDRIDNGRGTWGKHFGPLYYHPEGTPRNGQPTQYDDRAASDYLGADPILITNDREVSHAHHVR